MMNRGILNPIQHIYEPPVVADCFEADIEAQLLGNVQTEEEQYVVFPPLFGLTIRGLTSPNPDDIFYELPPMNVNVYVDGELAGTVVQRGQRCTQDTLAEIASERMMSIMQQIDMMNTCVFDEYGVHRVKVEPVEDIAGRARGVGYVLIGAMGSTSSYIVALTLIQQPSNRAYYEIEDNVGDLFKFAQFSGMIIRNPVVVEPIPDVQFRSANYAYYGQFGAAIVPRVTITAQNTQNAPEGWRIFFFAGSISQLVIQGKIMDANVTGDGNRWDELESVVGEYGLHIYVDKDLVDNYKALNEYVAPYVYSDEVLPDPPVIKAPGVYYKESLGLISFSNNGLQRYTMTDKNLGADTVYNFGDEMSESNCGKYYQRGNCYGFPYEGEVTKWRAQVDIGSYGPSGYYSGQFDTYVPRAYNFLDAWGGQTKTNEARRGPCPYGYHIPSYAEITALQNVGIDDTEIFCRALKIPMSGFYNNGGGHREIGTSGCIWSSDCTSGGKGYSFNFYRNNVQGVSSHFDINIGQNIRPFKNNPVAPDDTWIKVY